MDGTGTQYNLGQDLRPGLAGQTFTVSAFKREIEINGPGMRTTQTRTPNFAYFQGPQAQTQVQGVDGDVAYNVGANGTPARASATVAADRRAEQFHHPLRLLRVALAADAKLSPVRTEGPERLVEVTTDAGPITLAVAADGKPTRILSPGSHINLGDVELTTTLADYADAGGLQLPTRLATLVDDFTTGTYQVKNTVAATGEVDAPAEARNAALPPGADGERRGRGSRAGRVVPRRPVAPQRGRRLQGPPGADRSAAERGPHAGGHRQGA